MTNGQSFALSFPKEKKGCKYEIVYDDFSDDISGRLKIRFKLSRSDIINYNFTKHSELFRN